jgi:hypothetical protein
MTILEIAVYVAVLSGASPIVCHLQDSATTACSNGYVAQALALDTIRFGNGVTVKRGGDRFPVFSNGLTSSLSGNGWLVFSNGIGVRRNDGDVYVFNNGLTCRTKLPDLIDCAKPAS